MRNTYPKIGRKLLAKNTLLNLVGHVFPFLVAVFSIPIIIKAIGTDRLGILTLVWAVIGYFSLFDLGLGRALTHELAKRLTKQSSEKDLSIIVWTSLFLLLLLGGMGLLIGITIAKWITYKVLTIPASLRHETLYSLYFLSATLPVVIMTTGVKGILHAHQRFDLINIVQIPLGVFSFLGPLIVVFFSSSLIPIICVLIGIRIIAFIAYYKFALKVMPYLKNQKIIKIHIMKSLFAYGGWMTVTNIVGPFLYYIDRFFLGAMVSLTSLAYYTTPYEVITKLWVIPISLARVLFPAFSTTYKKDLQYTARLFLSGVKYVFIVLFPIIFILFTFAFEGLKLWIGTEFAQNSTIVLRLLALGVFINSLTQIAINLIQGMGRPDLSAKLHLCELPIYLLAVWYLIKNYGIDGAAIAWLGRSSFDALILFIMTLRLLPIKKKTVMLMSGTFTVSVLICFMVFMLENVSEKLYFAGSALAIFYLLTWNFILSSEDRHWIKGIVNFNFG